MTVFRSEQYAQRLLAGAQKLGVKLDETQQEQLLEYLSLLHKWNGVYNLTAIRDPEQMLIQHLLDSLTVVPAFDSARQVLDVGAGAGLPGIVLAIARPDITVALIDTVQKKTAFLNQVKSELGLSNVTVHSGRVEQLPSTQKYDVITSRAFASLSDFVTWSGHLLAENGRFLAMKGTHPQEEIEKLPENWQVTGVKPLEVPELKAQRHLIVIERR